MRIHPNINKWKIIENQYSKYESTDIHIFVYSLRDVNFIKNKLDNIPRTKVNIHLYNKFDHLYVNMIGRRIEILVFYNYSQTNIDLLLNDQVRDYLRIHNKNREIPKIIII